VKIANSWENEITGFASILAKKKIDSNLIKIARKRIAYAGARYFPSRGRARRLGISQSDLYAAVQKGQISALIRYRRTIISHGALKA
jgi:hypothetical protein